MRLLALCALALALVSCTRAQQAQEGRFVQWEQLEAEGLPDQRVTIWLPPGYDQADQLYPVVYMHDGHNLFDRSVSNFDKIWAADKAMLQAMADGGIAPHIIVGIWAPGENRYRQYLPAFAPEMAEGELARQMTAIAGGPVISQAYLDWLAGDLKARVDAEFRTLSGPENTAIIGSSMGGIMSCWALAERPDVYGKAGCVSSHFPLIFAEAAEAQRPDVLGLWNRYLAANLGAPQGRRVWMDHGTETLDAVYPPYQAAIDDDFRAAGWVEGSDFRSTQYDGAEHEENAWAARLPDLFTWLLAEQ